MSKEGHIARLVAAWQAAGFGVWEYDAETGTVTVDQQIRTMIGLDDEHEPAPPTLRDIVHPDDMPAVAAAIEVALQQGSKGVSVVCRLINQQSRDIVRIASRGGRLSDSPGIKLAGIALSLDGEPGIEDYFGSPEFVRALLANSNVVAWAKDDAHRYVFLSENYQKRIGLRREEWFGKTEHDVWQAPIADRISRDHDELLADERPREILETMLDPDGTTTHWASSKFVFRDLVGGRYVGGLSVDISALHRAEEARRATQLHLDAFLDNDRFLAWVLDDRGYFVFMNAPFRARHDIDPQMVERTRLEDLFLPDAVTEALARSRQVLEQECALQFIDELPDAGGTGRWWLKMNFPIRHAGGRSYVGCMAMDITEQVELRQARDELRTLLQKFHSGQEEERKRIARDLHDVLGGTLAVIKSQIALIDSAVIRAAPAQVDAMTARIRELIDDLLSDADRLVAWLRPPSLDHLGLSAALEQLGRDFTDIYGIVCTVTTDLTSPRLDETSTVALYRIVQEALNNIARHARATEAAIALRHSRTRLLITIDDNGRGLPRDPQTRQRFGVLGMRERARLLDGSVTLEESPLGGVRVRISIPISPGN